MSISALAILFVTSVVTSMVSGALGMAGGMILLAVMTFVLSANDVVPLHGLVQLASNTTRTLAFMRHVRWTIFAIYAPCAGLGLAAAAWVWTGTFTWLKPAVGSFILLFLLWQKLAPERFAPPVWVYAPAGLVVGALSMFIGATGPLLAPFFLRDDFDKEEIIATKAACQLFLHSAKIPAFLAVGYDYLPHLPLVAALLVAVVIGTFTGKELVERISKELFMTVLRAVLFVMAVQLVVSALA
ncbi:MAG: sulfite exporter TauE/SafE family protein [Deltaproteobacteria bacterium]|nr:sulfite exporter TauE/SafE family protein [Deltaproteobacteria bacterium]